MSKSLGGILEEGNMLEIGGRWVAWANIAVSGTTFIVGLQDGLTWEDDGLNLLSLAAGVTGLTFGGWIAVGAGVISIGIGIYTVNNY